MSNHYHQLNNESSAAANVGFVGTALIVTSVMSQLVMILLARLLGPEDFGIYAICIVFINLLAILSIFGLDAAAIHRQSNTDRAIQNATVLRFLFSSAFACMIVLLAPCIADAIGNRDLVEPLRVSGLAVAIGSLGFETFIRLHKSLQFKHLSIVRIANAGVWSAGALVLSYLGFGWWSLLVAYILGLAAAAAVLWVIRPWNVIYNIDPRIAYDLLRYGSFPMGAALLTFLIWNIDKLAVGAILGNPTLLGAYYIAFNYGTIVPNLFTGAVTTVMFPTLSKMQGDVIGLKRGYQRAVRYISYVSIPAGVGLAAVSESFVVGVLGSEWEDAVVPIFVLALVGILISLASPASSVFLATGNPHRMFRQTLAVAVPFFILLFPSIYYFELLGMTLLLFAVASVSLTWTLMMVADILGLPTLEQIRMLAPPALTAMIMFIPTFYVGVTLGPTVATLGIQMAIGITVYMGGLYLITRGEVMKEVIDLLSSMRRTQSR